MLKAGAAAWAQSQDDWLSCATPAQGTGRRIWCETVQDINALADRIRRAGGVL